MLRSPGLPACLLGRVANHHIRVVASTQQQRAGQPRQVEAVARLQEETQQGLA